MMMLLGQRLIILYISVLSLGCTLDVSIFEKVDSSLVPLIPDTNKPSQVGVLSLGATHACALGAQGNLKCWGSNSYGQLGYDDVLNRPSVAGLGLVTIGTETSFKSLSVGGSSTCVITSQGGTKCWGLNSNGQLGYGHKVNLGGSPADMANLPEVDFGGGHQAKQVVMGTSHACAILDDGNLKCWGRNTTGQLGVDSVASVGDGVGLSVSAAPVVDLGDGKTAKKVAIGNSHTCAILNDDTVKCWGLNTSGQLGYEDVQPRGNATNVMSGVGPVNLGPGKTAKQIAASANTTCAILDDDSLKCWGANSNGGLGYEDNVNRGDVALSMTNLQSVNLGSERTAKKVAIGSSTTCTLLDNDSLKCWGQNSYGQLGMDSAKGSVGSSAGDMASLAPLNFGANVSVVDFAMGDLSVCAMLTDGSVRCWGSNYNGQLGYGDYINRGGEGFKTQKVVDFGAGKFAKSLSLGTFHSCASLNDGSVKCWGHGNMGRLGLDSMTGYGSTPGSMSSLPFVAVGMAADLVEVGDAYSCAISVSHQLKCWGSNDYGELGAGRSNAVAYAPGVDSITNLVPVNVGAGRTVLSVAAGLNHTCAILDGGELRCWGGNSQGQLGYNDTNSRGKNAAEMTSLAAVYLGVGRTALMVDTGGKHTCALLDNGEVKCWGGNSNGQLGYDDTLSRGGTVGSMAALSAVDLGRPAVAIAVGDSFSCAILDNATLKCWGANSRGQLGQDSSGDIGKTAGSMAVLSAVNLGVGRTVKSIALGKEHTCALLDNDKVKCWGFSNSGQLGIGYPGLSWGSTVGSMQSLAYVTIAEGKAVKKLAAGANHNCAILIDNTVQCWGANSFGQLGIDDASIRTGALEFDFAKDLALTF